MDGVAAGATANATDAQLRDRTTHVGTQAISTVAGLQAELDAKATSAGLTAHTGATNNPHSVTKGQVGLGNVDNTSDALKPISNATQTALNAKEGTVTAGTSSQYYRGDKSWQTLDKAAVGLGNLDNTSDTNKPVSTATQTALNLKANLASPTFTGVPAAPTATGGTNTTQVATTAFVQTAISGKENTITLSTSDKYYRGDKTWQTLPTYEVPSQAEAETGTATNARLWTAERINQAIQALAPVGGGGGSVGSVGLTAPTGLTVSGSPITTSGTLGLTYEAGYAIPTLTKQGQWDTAYGWGNHASAGYQANISTGDNTQYYRGDKTWQTLNKAAVGLSNVDNTADTSKPISTATQSALDLKAPLASPALTGTPTAPTQTSGDSSTKIATTAFVKAQGYLTSAPVTSVATKTGAVTLVKGDVGLNNVDNTADADKPVSTAQQTALNLKANLASPTFTGTPITSSPATTDDSYRIATTNFAREIAGRNSSTWQNLNMNGAGGYGDEYRGRILTIGGSPANSGVTTAYNWPLHGGDGQIVKWTLRTTGEGTYVCQMATMIQGLANDVGRTFVRTKISTDPWSAWKELILENALTVALSGKEDSITVGSSNQYWKGDKTWATLDKAAVGLGSVDNTSDTGKPISTATQTALDLKANLASPALTGTPTAPTASAATNTTQVATTAYVKSQGYLTSAPVTSVATKTGAVTLVKGDVGLGNVDNTSDATKNSATVTLTNKTISGSDNTLSNIPTSAVTGLDSALAGKESTITASTTDKYWRGDKSWQTLPVYSIPGQAEAEAGTATTARVWTAERVKQAIVALTPPGNSGTVTSVGMTVPTGLTIGGSPVTASGTLAVTYTAGYSIPTTAKQGQWDTAYGWGNHASAGYQANISTGTTSQYYRGDKSWVTLDKAAVGLGNVDNTADTSKPISTATQSALDLKAPLASPALTGTPTAPTASAATNTTQIATTAYVKSQGYLTSAPVTSVASKTGAVTLVKGDVGLGNVDNTTDLNKPISTATQTALNAKQPTVIGGATFDINGSGPSEQPNGVYVSDLGTTQGTTLNPTYTLGLMTQTSAARSIGFSVDVTGYLYGFYSYTTAGTYTWTSKVRNADTLTTARTISLTGDATGSVSFNGSANVSISTTVSGLTGKENTITGGTTGQYWRGDKSWQTLDKTAVGLGNVDNTSNATERAATATLTNKTISGASNTLSNIPQSAVTSLTSDLGAKAPLASPALTGTPTAPTASAATNTTQIATTAYVKSQGYLTSAPVTSVATKTGAVTLVKADVGLGNVDNTADTDKPISTATQTALDAKAPLASPTFTGTPIAPTAANATNTTQIATTAFVKAQGYLTSAPVTSVATKTGAVTLVKGDVGLGNVDNTADTAKPISTATQTALDLKAPLASPALTGIPTAPTAATATNTTQIATTAYVKAQGYITSAPVASVAGKTGAVTLVKGDVGLGNVDNTADTAKPVSSAQQTALDAKLNIDGTSTMTGTLKTAEVTGTSGSNLTLRAPTTYSLGVVNGGGTHLLVGNNVSSIVNYAFIYGGTAADNIVRFAAGGSSTDIWIRLVPKGNAGVDFNNARATSIAAPYSNTDGANKAYVDQLIPNYQTGTSYTLVLTDAGKSIDMNNSSANTLTVPPNSSVAFPVNTMIYVNQRGTGQTTIAAGSGVTINTPDGLKIRKQWAMAALIKEDTDVWRAIGTIA